MLRKQISFLSIREFLAGEGKTRKLKDWEVEMLWMAFRGENARWWEMAGEIN